MASFLGHLPIAPELASEFLGVFARCEYALKSAGYARGDDNGVNAKWDAFAKDIDWHFRRIKTRYFVSAVNFLLTEPPRKQVLQGRYLQWKSAPPNNLIPKAQQTLLMVRRVRNNLFHGAKVWSPEYGPRDRDERLIRSSLAILQRVMTINEQVHIAFQYGVF
jgi:hypothetical protein